MKQLPGFWIVRWRDRHGIVPCALGGLAFGLTMPPWGLWGLAWIALVPLWRWGIQRGSWRGVVAWGFLYEGLTLQWLWDLHPLTWMGIPWWPSLLIALGCWLGAIAWRLGSFLLWTQLMFRLTSRRSKSGTGASWQSRSSGLRVLWGTALWCAIDSFWSWGPLYWDSWALSQSPHNLPILHLGRLAGPMAITGAIVAVNGLLAEAWNLQLISGSSHAEVGDSPTPSQGLRPRQLLGVAVALVVGLHGLGGLLSLQGDRARANLPGSGPALQVGVVQGNIPTRRKLTAAGVNLALQRYSQGFESLAAQGADAVLLPEGAFPFLWSEQRQTLGQPFLAAIARHPTTQVWLGAFERGEKVYGSEPIGRDEIADPDIRQSLLALDAEGRVTSRYNKIKLVPLGEYLPAEALLGRVLGRLSGLPESLVPGQASQHFETAWGRAAVMICYEPAFSQISRRQVRAGGQWLLNSANLDPYSDVLMAQSEALGVIRAIESDRWLVQATNTGYSGVIDPGGRVMWRSPPREFVTHAAVIYPRQSQTLYGQWGDWLTPTLLAGAAATFFWQQRLKP